MSQHLGKVHNVLLSVTIKVNLEYCGAIKILGEMVNYSKVNQKIKCPKGVG